MKNVFGFTLTRSVNSQITVMTCLIIVDLRPSMKMIILIQKAIEAFKNMDKPMNAPSSPNIDPPKIDKRLSRSRVYRTIENNLNRLIVQYLEGTINTI